MDIEVDGEDIRRRRWRGRAGERHIQICLGGGERERERERGERDRERGEKGKKREGERGVERERQIEIGTSVKNSKCSYSDETRLFG